MVGLFSDVACWLSWFAIVYLGNEQQKMKVHESILAWCLVWSIHLQCWALSFELSLVDPNVIITVGRLNKMVLFGSLHSFYFHATRVSTLLAHEDFFHQAVALCRL